MMPLSSLAQAARLLAVADLERCLTTRTMRTGRDRDSVTVHLSPTEAAAARDAVCKAIRSMVRWWPSILVEPQLAAKRP